MATTIIRLAADAGAVSINRVADSGRIAIELDQDDDNKVQLDMSYSQARILHMRLGRFCIA